MVTSTASSEGCERRATLDEERLPTRTYVLGLLVILAAALTLRLPGFGHIPVGLYRDEASNGLDALQVLQGSHPLWFSANNGREPFFIYLVALSIKVFGRTATAVRAPALLLGLLTVPATAFLARQLFDRRVALLSAAVTAVTFWPVQLSRIGFRAVGLPLFTALALGFLWRGLRHGRLRDYCLAGAFCGAAFYTYLPARLTPLALLALAMLALRPGARLPRPRVRDVAAFAGAALPVAAPLLAYMVQHPEAFAGRIGQVSVFNPAIAQGHLFGLVARQTLRVLGAFFVRGDAIARHNLPGRPIFEPALALAFLAGIIAALRRRGAGWFVLAWVGIMLVPSILAEDAPHFLRSVGIQPLVFVLPALGLDWAWRRLAKAGRPALGMGLTVAALLIATGSTTWAYFRTYAHAQTVYYHFEGCASELAGRIDEFLATPGELHVAYVSERLWYDWPSLRFLLPEDPNLRIINPEAPPAEVPARDVLLAVLPSESYEPALALLPPGSRLEVSDELQTRGDRDAEAHQFARVYTTTAGP